MDRERWCIGPLQVVTYDDILPHRYVVINKRTIEQICTADALPPHLHVQSCPAGYVLMPGMIDQHIHGLYGVDVMDGKKEALQTMSRQLAQFGVTSFLATTMTASIEQLEHVLHTCSTVNVEGAQLLGVHLEGPFISEVQKGAQPATHIIPPSRQLFLKLQQAAHNTIELVTLAPENDKDDMLALLKQLHIVASIGHSNATYEEALASVNNELIQSATHFYNGMRPIHHREPGLQVALMMSNAYIEVIADGHHVHPAMLQLLYESVGAERLILISDSMRATGLGNGTYDLGGQLVVVRDGKCMLADGSSLAGSVLDLNTARNNMQHWLQLSYTELAKMTATNSAKLLGYGQQKGQIAVGYDADFYVIDKQHNVLLTVREGQLIFQCEEARQYETD